MFWPFKRRCSSESEADTKILNYCRIFHSKMSQLYWLAYVLTADHAKAEECFVNGLERCLESNHVFQNWAESWSRRVIIKNAIRVMAPSHENYQEESNDPVENGASEDWPTSALLALDAFGRFLFVMSVLERYSIQECAMLLSCCPLQAVQARDRALRHFAGAALNANHFEITKSFNAQAQMWRNQ
jgi:hypothetical protein